MNEDSTKQLGQVIRIDDDRVRDHLKNVVRGSVEDTLNAMLDAEAERFCNAGGMNGPRRGWTQPRSSARTCARLQ